MSYEEPQDSRQVREAVLTAILTAAATQAVNWLFHWIGNMLDRRGEPQVNVYVTPCEGEEEEEVED